MGLGHHMGPNLFNTGYPSHGVVGIPSGVTRARERGCKACDGVRSAHWREQLGEALVSDNGRLRAIAAGLWGRTGEVDPHVCWPMVGRK